MGVTGTRSVRVKAIAHYASLRVPQDRLVPQHDRTLSTVLFVF